MIAKGPPLVARGKRKSKPVYSTSVRLDGELLGRLDRMVSVEPSLVSRSDAINKAILFWLRHAEAQIAARK
jgi:metal-responsive CopG/Arc/MetJ family transcriptional regulator